MGKILLKKKKSKLEQSCTLIYKRSRHYTDYLHLIIYLNLHNVKKLQNTFAFRYLTLQSKTKCHFNVT